MRTCSLAVFQAVCCFLFTLAAAAMAQPSTNRLTLATADTESKEALKGFQLEAGFSIELAVAEPMVSRPVAIAFDENNRLFVAEMPLTPAGTQQASERGRVRLLDAPDEKGRFRSSTVFSEDVAWPSAVACYAGGVFVASSHEIVYLKDTDADGIADVRKVVFTGFGGTNALNSENLLNSFTWALDNRIHVATAGIGGAALGESLREPVPLEGTDFSFDPRTLILIPENGKASSGLCFDNAGRQYVSEPSRGLRLATSERRYWTRNPFYVRAAPFQDVISPATAIYQTKVAQEDQSGASKSRTNETSATWLTQARGLTIYRGHIFPTNYFGNAFICDPEAHVVHRVVLQDNGLEVLGARPANERNREFLMSADPDFRPMQVVNGPDGALYIADARNGENGRVYRILPESATRSQPAKLGNSRTYDLVAALAHPNGWHRDTAGRLLFEKRDPAASPLLSNVVSQSQMPLARIHALHVLAGSGFLRDAQVVKAMQDKDPNVRLHALLSSEVLSLNGSMPESVWNQIKSMTADPSIRVRNQLASTLGALRRPDRAVLLAQLLTRDANNLWLQSSVLSSLSDTAGNLFLILAGDRRFRSDPAGLNFLQRLAAMIGVKGRMDEVGQVIGFVSREKLEPLQGYSLLHALGDGLRRTRSSLGLVDQQGLLQGWYSTALLTAVDVSAPEFLRAQAVRFVGVTPYNYTDTSDWLLLLANPQPLLGLRSTAVSTLTGYDDARLVPALLERWSGFPPAIRREATDGLLSRANRVLLVMNAIERGAIPVGDLLSPTLNFLRTWPEPGISERALRAFGPVPSRRPSVLEQYAPSLRLAGVASRGRELFRLRCAECHAFGAGANRYMGGDLAGVRVNGRAKLLSSILEPSAEIDESFRTWIVETQEGQLLPGVKADENAASITLLQKGGNSGVWSRSSIRGIYDRSWSLMPDGLEQGLSQQNMADLLEFLMNPQ